MADEELLSLAAESDLLTDCARNALWDELRNRRLDQEAARAYQQRPAETEPAGTPPEKLVTVATYHEPIGAHLAKTKLESEGIECFLADEHIVRMYSWVSFALGHLKLQVKESDAEKAVAALGREGEGNLE